MRCFLAIELGKEAKDELTRLQKQIPQDIAKSKLVEHENLHLTMKFFGELTDSEVNKIKELLKHVKFSKFKAHLGSVGFFPSSDYIRVIWVSMEPSDKVKELHRLVDDILKKEKIREDIQFESHMTLARVKFVKDKKGFVDNLKQIKVKPVSFEVSSFVMKKSVLTEKGPVYEDIAKFELL